MTKKELEDQVKALRAKLDEAHVELDELKSEKKQLGELSEVAVGGLYDPESREWVMASIRFNKDTKEAKVVDLDVVGGDVAMFQYKINKFLSEEIFLKNMRR